MNSRRARLRATRRGARDRNPERGIDARHAPVRNPLGGRNHPVVRGL